MEMLQKETKSLQPSSLKSIRATDHNSKYNSKFNKKSQERNFRDRSQSRNRNSIVNVDVVVGSTMKKHVPLMSGNVLRVKKSVIFHQCAEVNKTKY